MNVLAQYHSKVSGDSRLPLGYKKLNSALFSLSNEG